jgi:hypothetical protein
VDEVSNVYQVVGDGLPKLFLSEAEFAKQYKVTSYNIGIGHRPELARQPIADALCGPMWGGKNAYGQNIIRYETWAAYAVLSR